MYIYVYMYVLQGMQRRVMSPQIHIHAYIRMHIYIHVYVYICTYVYVCVCELYEWVTPYVYEPGHIWVSHVTHMNESCLRHNTPCCHIGSAWESHVTHMNESCTSRIWISHVTYRWVMLHMNTSRHALVSHVHTMLPHRCCMNASCHIWMSHVTYRWVMSHMNNLCLIFHSCHTYEWAMSQTRHTMIALAYDVAYVWIRHVTAVVSRVFICY